MSRFYGMTATRMHMPAKNLMAAVAGLGLGLFCVWLSLGEAPTGADAQWSEPAPTDEPAQRESDDAGESTVSDRQDSGVTEPADLATPTSPEIAENEPAALPDPETEESVTAQANPVPEARPEEPRVADSPLRLRRGRLAYLRCGDLDMTGRCPRDQDMEAEAWRVLGTLTSCGRLQAGGTGDVRFVLGSEPTEARFRDHGERPFQADDLVACLGDSIAAVRTTLPADGIVVSFRFSLVP